MTSPAILSAQVYDLIEVARLRVGPAITSMSAASVAVANGNTDEDITDAIGSAMVRINESFELLGAAYDALKEIQRASKEMVVS